MERNFAAHLPRVQGKAAASQSPPAGGSETILLVDDEEAVRQITRRLLEMCGYRVHEASSGRQALEVWREHGPEVGLLLTDVVMPEGLDGRELARRLWSERPNLKVIFMSGYPPQAGDTSLGFPEGPNSCFLHKPCNGNTLLETVRRCLDGVPQPPTGTTARPGMRPKGLQG